MLRDAFMFCDLCLTPMGQLWSLPAQAPGLIDCPRDCICPDCQPLEETPCWSAMNAVRNSRKTTNLPTSKTASRSVFGAIPSLKSN